MYKNIAQKNMNKFHVAIQSICEEEYENLDIRKFVVRVTSLCIILAALALIQAHQTTTSVLFSSMSNGSTNYFVAFCVKLQ